MPSASSRAALVILVWSSFIPVSRLGLAGTLEPPDLVALRFVVAGVVMLPVLLRGGTGGLGPWRALLLALTAGIGFSTLAYTGLALAPASHAAVLMPGTLPLWTGRSSGWATSASRSSRSPGRSSPWRRGLFGSRRSGRPRSWRSSRAPCSRR